MTDDAAQLSLLAPPQQHAASTTHARLLVFNTQHASPARAYRQAEWISQQETADLVVLTEASSGPGGTALVEAMHHFGYAHVIAPPADPRDYRTLLASRTAPLYPVDAGVTFLPHRAPAAIATIGGQKLGIVGLYVPSRGPKERRNVDKRQFQEAVTTALTGLSNVCAHMPVVAAGDLNVLEPGHEPPHKVFGRWEYAFYESFATAGFTDAYRHLHPAAVEHSWFGRSGRGFRFDHAFITNTHTAQVEVCAYDQRPRAASLSDHAAMVLTLGLTAGDASGRPVRDRATRLVGEL
ncbi:endonuclease/exonuclease/phosphatase family protein [Streptomyces cavernicola]|uniref:Endonuclease n=1 Tax=Streptomyces cavernicola TaxID=3043613 RepID=A0ABT6SJ17_9ACTN|nr:endonuclease/exonuclease/phosphatase family protein [Streptomyces sp. B-S-A6]MDI3407662.1 endonuclease [Streptomyces sp. B-S-A6]